MAALSGTKSDVLVSATPSISASNEAMSNTDSGTWKVWQVTSTSRRYWDDSQTLTIQDSSDGSTGWADVDASTYSFNYCGGIITFASAHAKHFIRISAGYYFNVASLADCSDWSLDLGAETEDSTTFQATWAINTATVKKASAKISSFIHDATLSALLGNRMILILYADKSAGSRWECYALLSAVAPKSSATKLVTQEASFACEGVYFYTS